MSINELQDEVIAEFSDFDDWMDRYQLLIDRNIHGQTIIDDIIITICYPHDNARH